MSARTSAISLLFALVVFNVAKASHNAFKNDDSPSSVQGRRTLRTAEVIQFVTTNVEVSEGSNYIDVYVTRFPPSANPVSVTVTTIPGTAKPGSDYTPVSGVGTFNEYEWLKYVRIPIIDDYDEEQDKQFYIRLSRATNGAVVGTKNPVVVKIIDDDCDTSYCSEDLPELIQFAHDQQEVFENQKVQVVVQRFPPQTKHRITVKWQTLDGTARNNVDYIGGQGTLTFQPGDILAFINIKIKDDGIPESNKKTFYVRLYGVTGGADLGYRVKIPIVIKDDDN